MTAKGYAVLGVVVIALIIALQYHREIDHRFFPRHFWTGEVNSCEASLKDQKDKCTALEELIQLAGETGNQSKNTEDLGVKESKPGDEDVVNKAQQKVEAGASMFSNDLVRCQSTVQKKEQELEAARAELAKVQ
jgi:hypothetical protein